MHLALHKALAKSFAHLASLPNRAFCPLYESQRGSAIRLPGSGQVPALFSDAAGIGVKRVEQSGLPYGGKAEGYQGLKNLHAYVSLRPFYEHIHTYFYLHSFIYV